MNCLAKASVALSVLVFLFAASLAYAQSTVPQPVQQLAVWDSKGKMVGNVISFATFANLPAAPSRPVVGFRGQSTTFLLGVATNTFFTIGFGTVQDALYFQSANCTGTAYFDQGAFTADPDPMVPVSIENQNKIYEQVGPPISLLIGSFFLFGNCDPVGTQLTVRELRLAVDLNIFTPPFTVR